MSEEKFEKSFEPSLGIIVYKKDSDFYLQAHEIGKNGDKYSWGEGKPLKKEQLQELAQSISKQNLASMELSGLLPENILYYQPAISGNRIVWWIAPSERYIHFSSHLKIKSGKCRLPALLLAAHDRKMYVFALKGSKKPTIKTEIFNAPFYNLYDNGDVCLGTTSETRKKNYLHEEMDRWERRFFGSRFTDAHGDDDRLNKGWTMKKLYGDILSGKKFPEASLLAARFKTIEGFLKHFTGRRSNEER
jgi:PRTRC genetic system protein B